jgi:hypothetical protein
MDLALSIRPGPDNASRIDPAKSPGRTVKGAQLLAVYLILAITFFFLPS